MPEATYAVRSRYNEEPMKRFRFALLLVVQAFAGGAVSLAHARDVFVSQAGIEDVHTNRCAILHDELRCALCHYAGTRVVAQQPMLDPAASTTRPLLVPLQQIATVTTAVRFTPPPRAPPSVLS